MIELTRFTKIGGPLTKRIELSADGKLISDGSACVMSSGRAQRAQFDRLGDVAELIQSLESHEVARRTPGRWLRDRLVDPRAIIHT